MAQLHVHDDVLVVHMSMWDTMLSVKSTFSVPLSSVVRAYSDPFVHEEPRGFKAPGTYWPGLITKGTFRASGVKTFWNIRRGESVVVVELENESFDRLIIEQDDADAIATQIMSAKEMLS